MSYEVGAKIYTYYLDKAGKTYKIADYSFNLGTKDQRATVEKSLKTFVLLQ